eukprot:TRINITY_DN11250_c0_g1_i1.p1 TRINITY_DN11250_c0_g1~~TRINITY_DN11250_c0_g1_i1.p1  ORF type:complete len:267 (+),score=-32.19 TRINITY_DN11250_c0_g1_i1:724-1524(+)
MISFRQQYGKPLDDYQPNTSTKISPVHRCTKFNQKKLILKKINLNSCYCKTFVKDKLYQQQLNQLKQYSYTNIIYNYYYKILKQQFTHMYIEINSLKIGVSPGCNTCIMLTALTITYITQYKLSFQLDINLLKYIFYQNIIQYKIVFTPNQIQHILFVIFIYTYINPKKLYRSLNAIVKISQNRYSQIIGTEIIGNVTQQQFVQKVQMLQIIFKKIYLNKNLIISTYLCKCIFTYTHTYIHSFIHMYICVSVCVCMYSLYKQISMS